MKVRLNNPRDGATQAEIEENPQFVTALKRGLEVLNLLAKSGRAMGNADIASATGLPKATVTRATFTLLALGYINYDRSTGRYSVGASAISLGYGAMGGNAILRVAQPHMRTFANRYHVSVALGESSGLEMVYVGNELREEDVGVRLFPGASLPLESTAIGHAYLCGVDSAHRARLLLQFEEKEDKSFAQLRGKIQESFAQFSRLGFCIVGGLWDPMVSTVGVPLTLAGEERTIVFTASGLSTDTAIERLESEIGPALRAMVGQIARALGQAL